jgi:hypothetical protein
MKAIILKISFIFLFLSSMGAGCEKKEEQDNIQIKQGLVLNYGDPSVDGCGWVIQINEIIYSPLKLDAEFQKDSLKINIEYRVLNATATCGWYNPGYSKIEIIKIYK